MRKIVELDHADTWAAISAAREAIEAQNKPLVMVVVDSHGEVLALFRHAAAMLSSITIATNKAYTAARLRRPSAAVGHKAREDGFDIASFGDPRVIGFGGGLPIFYDGCVIGGVGVSGLPEAEDIEMAQTAIHAIEAHWRNSNP